MQCANSLTSKKERAREREREREIPSEPRNKRADIVFRNHFFCPASRGRACFPLPAAFCSCSSFTSSFLLNFSPIAHTKWNYPWELLRMPDQANPGQRRRHHCIPLPMPQIWQSIRIRSGNKNCIKLFVEYSKKHTHSISPNQNPQLPLLSGHPKNSN